jgi:hypothetical protein
MYGEFVSRELCDTGCQQILIVDIQHPYEWYDFYLSGKVIKKWVKNENNTVSQNLDLQTIQILNAERYSDTDFACYTTMTDNSVTYTQLVPSYHEDMKTLTLMDQYGFALNVFNLQAVYFGNSAIDSNQCTNYKQDFYRFTNFPVDLSSSYVYGQMLESQEFKNSTEHDTPMLSMTLYEGRGAFIDIQWSNYGSVEKNREQAKPPLDPHPVYGRVSTRPLSTYVAITQPDGEGFHISVSTEQGTLVYELNGFVLDEYNEYVDATVHVKNTDPFRGIIGLGDHDDRENATLFLEDGVYSMNNRGKATTYTNGRLPGTNSFGTYPFLMGRCDDGDENTASQWFGVLHKNLAA